jgi:hypothetical protein
MRKRRVAAVFATVGIVDSYLLARSGKRLDGAK